MSVELKAYKGSAVAKVFPLYGDKPFKGIVDKVDARDKKTPFHITYDDGDAEWISYEELLQIVQKAPVDAAPKKTPASDDTARKRAGGKTTEAALATAAKHSSKKHKSGKLEAASAGAGGGASTAAAATAAFDADKAKRSLKDQAGGLQGMTQFTFTAGSARRAAAAGVDAVDATSPGSDDTEHEEAAPAADGAAASDKAAAATSGKASTSKAAAPAPAPPASPAPDLPQLLTSIHQTASMVGNQMAHHPPARLSYRGSGATMLPVMSQAVISAGQCHISLYSNGKGGSGTPGRGLLGPQQDYQTEAEAVLNELEKLLVHGSSSKGMLLKVRVTLRNMADVLPGFKAAWDTWVDTAAVPVLTLCEGAGPFITSNITLEATAYTKSG